MICRTPGVQSGEWLFEPKSNLVLELLRRSYTRRPMLALAVAGIHPASPGSGAPGSLRIPILRVSLSRQGALSAC